MDTRFDAEQAATWLDEHDIAWVKTEGISIDGLVIGKHLSTRKFMSSLPLGNAITEFVLGYDIGGTPFLVWWDDWRREALGDFHQRPDLVDARRRTRPPRHSQRDLRHRRPRGQLGSSVPAVEAAQHHQSSRRPWLDGEGRVRDRSDALPRVLRRRPRQEHQDLTPMSHPAPLGYLHFNSRQQLQFLDVVLQRLDGLGIPIEGLARRGRARASSSSTSTLLTLSRPATG